LHEKDNVIKFLLSELKESMLLISQNLGEFLSVTKKIATKRFT
jgi:hypothetical protein